MNKLIVRTRTRLFGKGAIVGLREQIPPRCSAYGGGSVKKTSILDQVLESPERSGHANWAVLSQTRLMKR